MAISFAPLWNTMKQNGVTTYALKHKLKIGGGTYNRLKNGEHVSTHTIEMLCQYLHCDVQDIIEFIPTHEKEHGPIELNQPKNSL